VSRNARLFTDCPQNPQTPIPLARQNLLVFPRISSMFFFFSGTSIEAWDLRFSLCSSRKRFFRQAEGQGPPPPFSVFPFFPSLLTPLLGASTHVFLNLPDPFSDSRLFSSLAVFLHLFLFLFALVLSPRRLPVLSHFLGSSPTPAFFLSGFSI